MICQICMKNCYDVFLKNPAHCPGVPNRRGAQFARAQFAAPTFSRGPKKWQTGLQKVRGLICRGHFGGVKNFDLFFHSECGLRDEQYSFRGGEYRTLSCWFLTWFLRPLLLFILLYVKSPDLQIRDDPADLVFCGDDVCLPLRVSIQIIIFSKHPLSQDKSCGNFKFSVKSNTQNKIFSQHKFGSRCLCLNIHMRLTDQHISQ